MNPRVSSNNHSLPRRGEKDFEQDGTKFQDNILADSRDAMHNALAHTRTHQPRGNVLGLFDPEEDTVIVENPTGPHFRTIGKSIGGSKLRLLPEEALYMVERGSLDLRWSNIEELEGLPLSLQAAYTYLLGSQGLSLERYIVYAGLKRSGYRVFRAPTWFPEDHDKSKVPPRTPPEALGIFAQLYTYLFSTTRPPVPSPIGPLVHPGLYRSYLPIYHQLALIPYHDPTLITPLEAGRPFKSTLDSDLRIRPSYLVWKPSRPDFRKSAPPPPDFYIAVVNAREDSFPDYEQLDELLQCMPYDPPNKDGQLYTKMKQGYRNVIIAVVDQGVTSYVRVADVGLGMEKVWDRGKKGPQGGKRGGGRGRGRVRGGGDRGGRSGRGGQRGQ